MSRGYCVRLSFANRRIGAGFFVTSRLILTAAHCVQSLSDYELFYAFDISGGTDGAYAVRIVERNIKTDLALLEVFGKSPKPVLLEADRCNSGDPWRSPYQPGPTEPSLSGTVSRHDYDYECAGGDVITALQLRTEVELGDYSGYSGSPVENRVADEDPKLVGILLEQYPDRVDPERASNVLFAGAIGDALETFPQFRVKHLLKVLTDDEPDDTSPDASGTPGGIDAAVATAERMFEFLERCAARGLIGPEELRIRQLRVIDSVIEAGSS